MLFVHLSFEEYLVYVIAVKDGGSYAEEAGEKERKKEKEASR